MRQITGKRPENIRETFSALMSYMGRHKFLLLLVGILTSCQRPGEPAGHLHA